MSRAMMSIVGFCLLVSWCHADDDPPMRGKKLSEWIQQMQDPKGDIKSRRAGLLAMEIYGPKPQVVDAVVKLFETEKDVEIKKAAARTLGQFGGKNDVIKFTLHPLCDAIKKDPDDGVREAAINSLVRLAPTRETPKSDNDYANLHELFRGTAIPTLIEALKDKHTPVRVAAAEAVGKVGPDAKDGVADLLVLLKDKDDMCRRFAAFAIGRVGSDAATVVPKLNEALAKETAPKVRMNMIESLGLFGTDAGNSAEAIGQALLKDGDQDVRWASAIALRQIGAAGIKALPAILESVDKEKSKDVRCQSVKALGSVGRNESDKILPTLVKCLRSDTTVEVRLAAIEEATIAGRGNKELEDALTRLTKDFRKEIAQAAQDALKKMNE